MFFLKLRKQKQRIRFLLKTVKMLKRKMDRKTTMIEEALNIIEEQYHYAKAPNKQWIVDQVVRKLTGSDYEDWVDEYNGRYGRNKNGMPLYKMWKRDE